MAALGWLGNQLVTLWGVKGGLNPRGKAGKTTLSWEVGGKKKVEGS